jgi:hypothetical protein
VTRAELFRYLTERAGAKRSPREPRPPADAAAGAHHPSPRAGKNAQYAFEPSAGRPSRKSTRKAANRQKNDVQFRRKRQVREVRPEGRARGPAR